MSMVRWSTIVTPLNVFMQVLTHNLFFANVVVRGLVGKVLLLNGVVTHTAAHT